MKSYQSIYGTVSEDITTQTVTPTNHQLKIHNNTCKQEVLHTCVWQAVGRIRHHMGKTVCIRASLMVQLIFPAQMIHQCPSYIIEPSYSIYSFVLLACLSSSPEQAAKQMHKSVWISQYGRKEGACFRATSQPGSNTKWSARACTCFSTVRCWHAHGEQPQMRKEWTNVTKHELMAFTGLTVLAGSEKSWDVPVSVFVQGHCVNPKIWRVPVSLMPRGPEPADWKQTTWQLSATCGSCVIVLQRMNNVWRAEGGPSRARLTIYSPKWQKCL